MSRHPYEILVRPILTEKASAGAEEPNPNYTFLVHIRSNKVQIRRAIEAAFNVKVKKVNTIRVKGKRKRLRMREQGKRPDVKKAVVTLEKGQTINLI
jgi:large subunit ribosomal protein L23